MLLMMMEKNLQTDLIIITFRSLPVVIYNIAFYPYLTVENQCKILVIPLVTCCMVTNHVYLQQTSTV